jgi:membrane-bound lytic murein transglycosylase B
VFDTLSTLSFIKNRRNRFYQSELEALILFCIRNDISIKNVKGSHFGAIGLGQFMPSNYEYYGVDFNGDGKIRMQNPVDAIGSIANYLHKNGWKKGEEVAIRARYNGSRFRRYKTGYKKLYNLKKLKGIKPRGRWRYKGKVRLIKLNRAKYDELWIAARNFRVITRYNHSAYYAMSVHQLAQMIIQPQKGVSKN